LNPVTAEDSPYKISLPAFEGPLDLLLHLIRENEIDIYNIPISEITRQYLEYLGDMESLDLEIAGEWLVMAATLVEIKSRMLLPREKPVKADAEEQIDPRRELVERLIEYERFKTAAELFREKEEQRSRIFVRGPAELQFDLRPVFSLENISPEDLLSALQSVLAEAEGEPVTTIQRRKLTVRMRIRELWYRVRESAGQLTFRELFDDDRTPTDIVITFLALLELLKSGRIIARQEQAFGPIMIQQVLDLEDEQ
jgi:segregation and condensation protein A